IEYALGEDLSRALWCWKRACQLDGASQRLLLSTLAAHLPLQQVVSLVQPDFDGLIFLSDEKFTKDAPQVVPYLAKHARACLDHDAKLACTSDKWMVWVVLSLRAGILAQADECIQKAITLNPYEPQYQIALIQLTIRRQLWDEALKYIVCARGRFPGRPE